MSNYIRAAFDNVVPDAQQAETWYVVLMSRERIYLGPWEGGTWGDRVTVECFREYNSYNEAEKMRRSIEKLAKEMTDEAQKNYGNHCLWQMEWLEARGFDADYLPENDGPTNYYVVICQEIPQNYEPSKTYE